MKEYDLKSDLPPHAYTIAKMALRLLS